MDENLLVPTEIFREKIRVYANSQRELHRERSLDSLRFGLGEIKERVQFLDNLNERDVLGLAKRIKRRKRATPEDMYRLSHAFLQDMENIKVFNKTPGALQILIKELTGKSSECQISAAECLCNFCLGDAPVCEKIASLAGSYLVTYLHSSEIQLVRLCLWTLANILATSSKGAQTCLQMQLIPQLWKLYIGDEIADNLMDYKEDSAICLQIIALNYASVLNEKDMEFLLEHANEKNPTCLPNEYHLQIIFQIFFTQEEVVANLPENLITYLISYSLSNIHNTAELSGAKENLMVLYAIRILGNILACVPSSYTKLLQELSSVCQINLIGFLNKLFNYKSSPIILEILWFLKNILRQEENNATFDINLLDKLQIKRENVVQQLMQKSG
uniref:IBB domain-containing protein n=1 Tax=Glossina austeni TaxID=7395 RepID=A0A1A9VW26_GLOAU